MIEFDLACAAADQTAAAYKDATGLRAEGDGYQEVGLENHI